MSGNVAITGLEDSTIGFEWPGRILQENDAVAVIAVSSVAHPSVQNVPKFTSLAELANSPNTAVIHTITSADIAAWGAHTFELSTDHTNASPHLRLQNRHPIGAKQTARCLL